MRCKYCHNPDTWAINDGTEMTVTEIIDNLKKNLAFYKNGGITVSGGEPLMQIEFVTALFSAAKKIGVHTALDTSGVLFDISNKNAYEALLSVTDLVLLDIKQMDSEKHKELCGFDNKNVLNFAKFLSEIKVDVQIRYVLVPEHTDSEDDLKKLGLFLSELQNVKALEVLPYHTMGVKKYEELGIPYPLQDVLPVTKESARKARQMILDNMKK